MKVTVIGSGGWGTALAVTLANNGHEVILHSINSKNADLMRRTGSNPRLEGVRLPESLRFSDLARADDGADAVVLATPSFAVRETARKLKDSVTDGMVLISVSKGIENDSSMRLSEVITSELGRHSRVAVLSGPSHAEEVGRGVPTGCVAASTELNTAVFVQNLFMNPAFRVYTSLDPMGVELCGALKNVFAVCAGICYGVGYGDNTIALLITRALAEMTRLGTALGGRNETFYGLAGAGDLIVTSMSRHSRNRRAGELIGAGRTVSEAMREVGAVVEGYYAARAAKELSEKTEVEMPISLEMYRILYEGKSPERVGLELMTRSKKLEHDM